MTDGAEVAPPTHIGLLDYFLPDDVADQLYTSKLPYVWKSGSQGVVYEIPANMNLDKPTWEAILKAKGEWYEGWGEHYISNRFLVKEAKGPVLAAVQPDEALRREVEMSTVTGVREFAAAMTSVKTSRAGKSYIIVEHGGNNLRERDTSGVRLITKLDPHAQVSGLFYNIFRVAQSFHDYGVTAGDLGKDMATGGNLLSIWDLSYWKRLKDIDDIAIREDILTFARNIENFYLEDIVQQPFHDQLQTALDMLKSGEITTFRGVADHIDRSFLESHKRWKPLSVFYDERIASWVGPNAVRTIHE